MTDWPRRKSRRSRMDCSTAATKFFTLSCYCLWRMRQAKSPGISVCEDVILGEPARLFRRCIGRYIDSNAIGRLVAGGILPFNGDRINALPASSRALSAKTDRQRAGDFPAGIFGTAGGAVPRFVAGDGNNPGADEAAVVSGVRI